MGDPTTVRHQFINRQFRCFYVTRRQEDPIHLNTIFTFETCTGRCCESMPREEVVIVASNRYLISNQKWSVAEVAGNALIHRHRRLWLK